MQGVYPHALAFFRLMGILLDARYRHPIVVKRRYSWSPTEADSTTCANISATILGTNQRL